LFITFQPTKVTTRCRRWSDRRSKAKPVASFASPLAGEAGLARGNAEGQAGEGK